ncbi:hypothetical protein ACJ41O_011576 [Fusarium nematophilum]
MVRVTLKQILPIALLLTTSVIAQRDGSTTAVERTRATDDSAAETATDEATNTAEDTAEATETATGKNDDDKSKDSTDTDTKDSSKGTKTGTKDSESATTTTEEATFSWNPTIPATSAPDLNAGSRSIQEGGYLALTVVVGMMTLGMALI